MHRLWRQVLRLSFVSPPSPCPLPRRPSAILACGAACVAACCSFCKGQGYIGWSHQAQHNWSHQAQHKRAGVSGRLAACLRLRLATCLRLQARCRGAGQAWSSDAGLRRAGGMTGKALLPAVRRLTGRWNSGARGQAAGCCPSWLAAEGGG
jgi:hypothetical protein